MKKTNYILIGIVITGCVFAFALETMQPAQQPKGLDWEQFEKDCDEAAAKTAGRSN